MFHILIEPSLDAVITLSESHVKSSQVTALCKAATVTQNQPCKLPCLAR
jgi:hypothetical protein